MPDKPQPKLGTLLSRQLKIDGRMESFIPKWISKQKLDHLLVPQAELLGEYDLWVGMPSGCLLSLRPPFTRIGIKQRIAVYPNVVMLQSLYPKRVQFHDERDHNYMLRAATVVYDNASVENQSYFKDEATFKQALKTILFSWRDA